MLAVSRARRNCNDSDGNGSQRSRNYRLFQEMVSYYRTTTVLNREWYRIIYNSQYRMRIKRLIYISCGLKWIRLL